MLTEAQKTQIVALRDQGLSFKKIGDYAKCHRNTVTRLLKPSNQSTVRPASRPVGRPTKFNRTKDSFLVRVIDKEPHLSASKIKKMYPQIFGCVSVRSIQHRLKNKLNRPARRAAKKPMLTEKMRKKRLDFAKLYQHWTPNDWNKVYFIT